MTSKDACCSSYRNCRASIRRYDDENPRVPHPPSSGTKLCIKWDDFHCSIPFTHHGSSRQNLSSWLSHFGNQILSVLFLILLFGSDNWPIERLFLFFFRLWRYLFLPSARRTVRVLPSIQRTQILKRPLLTTKHMPM